MEDSGDKLRYVISRNATPACVLLDQDGVREAVEDRSSVEMSASAWTMVRCVVLGVIVGYMKTRNVGSKKRLDTLNYVYGFKLQQLLFIILHSRMVSQRIVEQGGAALVADYGHQGTDGDTLRAFCRHAQVDPLELPGTADITADVDFSLLRTQISPDCAWHGPVSQVGLVKLF